MRRAGRALSGGTQNDCAGDGSNRGYALPSELAGTLDPFGGSDQNELVTRADHD